MFNRIHILSQIPNLANFLRNEVRNRLKLEPALKMLENLEIIDVKLHNAVLGQYLSNLEITDDDLCQLNGAKVLLADNDLVATVIKNHGKVKPGLDSISWIQSTWAGMDGLFKEKEVVEQIRQQKITVTRFSGPHFGHAMADYVLAQIINHERHFYDLYKSNHMEKQWNRGSSIMFDYRRTDELTAVVLGGSGAIGSYVCKKLVGFGMKVYAYGRSSKSENEIEQFCKDVGVLGYSNKLDKFLPLADYLVCILPSTGSTDNLLDGDTLQACAERKPVLVNVGRGNIITEASLVGALDHQWISSAVLDVFPVEPLPNDSVLWSRDDVLITPHIAAITRGVDVVQVFLDNYLLLATGHLPNYRVNFEIGY